MSHIMLPQDANPFGNVHGGVIMKYVDDAAGVAAARHVRGPAVTASVDRLDFFHPVYIGNLLIVRASLNMVGKSSMEVGVRVEAETLVTGLGQSRGHRLSDFCGPGHKPKARSGSPRLSWKPMKKKEETGWL